MLFCSKKNPHYYQQQLCIDGWFKFEVCWILNLYGTLSFM